MKLNETDRIVTVWAEAATGPGWSNPIYWVLVQEGHGKYRVEPIQPDEQPELLLALHSTAASISRLLTDTVTWADMRRTVDA